MGEAGFDSDQELGDSREELHSGGGHSSDSCQQANFPHLYQILTIYPVLYHPCLKCNMKGEKFDALGHSDLLEDAKFYQNAVVEYQSAYYSIQDKYTHQAHLLKEASGAL